MSAIYYEKLCSIKKVKIVLFWNYMDKINKNNKELIADIFHGYFNWDIFVSMRATSRNKRKIVGLQ